MASKPENLVSQAHGAGGFVSKINSDTQEVSGAGSLTALTTHTVFRARRRGNLAGLTAIPGHHLEHIERTSTHALGATDAGVVDLDGVGHVPVANEDVFQNVPAEQAVDAPAVTVVNDG
jgi:hypothetical protein